ncbi:hypothetical protein [Streptomyces melanosporofaciens]|uniref:Uncharacterized protein n=1 Tax=Streptomyces melanosporofaciens TaxID=67327 RepID=A0A1H5B1Z1_STRMJ|nr:hypothetical protein [Streptomyces melanosporofaciens]SED48094.1 hypothetical protein SAMN04490356_8633 [Streptomyces melanosporofaciens]
MPLFTANEERHLASLRELVNCPYIDVEHEEVEQLTPPLADLPPPADFNEKWRGVQLDGDIVSRGLRFTELGACWSTMTGEDYDDVSEDVEADRLIESEPPEIRGEFFLRSIHDILSQPAGPADPVETEFQRTFLSELRVMDQTPRSGAGMLTYLRLKPGTSPLEIWYSDIAAIGAPPYPGGFIQMDITYSEYLDALLLTKGTYGWQYLYTDISLADGFSDTVDYLEGMLSLFPQIFPNHDYSDLRVRLEARL